MFWLLLVIGDITAAALTWWTPIPFEAMAALTIALISLLLISWPIVFFNIDLLTNDMSKVDLIENDKGAFIGHKPRPYFFTEPTQGRAKIVLRGAHIVRIIMNAPGLTFEQKGVNRQSFEYWWIKDVSPGKSEWPVERLTGSPWSWWKYSMYRATGKVFVGIYPFQQLLYYPFSRLEQVTDDMAKGRVKYVVIPSVSDHVRVYPFQRYEDLPDNTTAKFFAVHFVLNLVARVANPVKAAYGQDKWNTALDNAARATVRELTKTRDLSYLSSSDTDNVSTQDSHEMTDILCKMTDEVQGRKEGGMRPRVGIEIDEVQIVSALPQTSKDDEETLRSPALAKYEKQATITRKEGEALGEAAILREQIKALKEGDEFGLAVIEKQKVVEAAQNGHATIFVNPDGRGNVQRATMAGVLDQGNRPRSQPQQNRANRKGGS